MFTQKFNRAVELISDFRNHIRSEWGFLVFTPPLEFRVGKTFSRFGFLSVIQV